jgi:hypothetical protein
MKPMDLSGLIKGLMVVIGIAIAAGKLSALKQWAIKEAFGPTRHTVMRSKPVSHGPDSIRISR